jgi:hypothetical protein
MTDLPKYSTNNEVKIEVEPTTNLNQMDILCMAMKLINNNFNEAVEKITKQLGISKQITIYSTADLCRIFNVSESTIYNYRKSGKLHYCNDGQKVWFTQEHIDEFNWLNDSRNKQSTIRKMA